MTQKGKEGRLKTTIIAAFLTLSATLLSFPGISAEFKELYWEDLVPKGFVVPPPPIDHNGNMTQAQPNAPLVESLNGEKVKIPGFVVPLEGNGDLITEFLLVPYFGACVHVPPPPSNQIVYVIFSEGVPIDNLYDAVWVTGELSTDGWSGDIASVGYRLSGITVSAFEG
ncbi:DUF3299 domain-containing protein [Glaciecola sp. XM2]|nr:DUF3299 domain-containing protein [Glaciecola sp. XM2]